MHGPQEYVGRVGIERLNKRLEILHGHIEHKNLLICKKKEGEERMTKNKLKLLKRKREISSNVA